MTMNIDVREIEAAIRALCVAQATNIGVEVTLPIVLPDNDFASVTVAPEGDLFLVHDSSSAAMVISSMGVKVGADIRRRFAPIVARFGCEVHGDRIVRRVAREQIGMAAVMVGNAIRAVADLATDARRTADHDFRSVVAEAVKAAAGDRVRSHQEVKGASGRAYQIQSVVLDASLRRPVAFIEPLANRASVSKHFTEFWDIHQAITSITLASVYDDQSDLRDTDRLLLQNVGTLISLPEAPERVRTIMVAHA